MAEVTAQLAVGEGAFGGGKGDLAAQLPGGMVGAGVGEERLDLGARAIEAAGQDAVRDKRVFTQFQDRGPAWSRWSIRSAGSPPAACHDRLASTISSARSHA
jgi:hypothetical protein